MAMTTVNTNPGAMIALQNLNATNRELAEVQIRINTGRKVSSAKDNGAIYAIAQNMRSEVASLGVVRESLDRVMSTTDVGIAAAEGISDLLKEMKEKVLAASDVSLDTASRQALDEDFRALRDQIGTIVQNAVFNGINIVNSGSTTLTALASADGTSVISVGNENLSFGGSIITISASATISALSAAQSLVAAIDTSFENVNKAAARLGTAARKLEVHDEFISKLSDSLQTGIGNLVDADLAVESARLQSLQVKQQLGAQALSIANQAPQITLSLFG